MNGTDAADAARVAASADPSGKPEDGKPEQGKNQPQIGFWTIVMSTFSAALGVQSKANKERDFGSGRVAPFIVAGILFTVLFVLTIVAVVSLVIP